MGKKVKCNCPPPGAPAWLATFADMMTLLMAFFVLLLSFAEVDAAKYRAVAGAMKEALGIVEKSKNVEVPTGSDNSENKQEKVKEKSAASKCDEMLKKREDEVARLYELLKKELKGLGSDQEFFIQRTEQEVVIRIQEQGAFPSGSDRITKEFLPKIVKLREVLARVEGGIRVTGHTDDIPIKNLRYRSNWELSAARAVSVVHELLKGGNIDPKRLSAVGYGDSRPVVENKDDASRARNRRVDIMLTPKIDPDLDTLGEDGKASAGDDGEAKAKVGGEEEPKSGADGEAKAGADDEAKAGADGEAKAGADGEAKAADAKADEEAGRP